MHRTAEPQALVRALTETTRRIDAAARRLPVAQLAVSAAPDGWSPNEILWHLRATADVYGEQITRIVHEDAPRWRHVSPRARMKTARYDQVPCAESFAAFTQQRAELVSLLGSLPPEAWQRVALVKVDHKGGRESPLTLLERVRGMLNHEEIHCAQMEEVAAALR
jgi:hypothetical protein